MTDDERKQLEELQKRLKEEQTAGLPFWEKAEQVYKDGAKVCVIPFCETPIYAKKLCTKHYQYMRQNRLDPITGGILYKRDQEGNVAADPDIQELPNMGPLKDWVYIGQTQEFIHKQDFERMNMQSAIALDGNVIKALIRSKKFDIKLYQRFIVFNPIEHETAIREGNPLPPACPNNVFNTFMPERVMWANGIGGLSPELDKLLDTISNNEPENRQYLDKWLAFFFKNMSVLGSALVIKGVHGSGKSVFGALLQTILGQYATTIRVADLESNHNSWIEDKLLIIGEEMNSGTVKEQKKTINAIKKYVSGGLITVNRKMVAQYNSNAFARWLFFSNANLPFLIEPTERRYSIIEAMTVLERSIGKKIDENRKHYAQELLNYLHTVDLTDFGAWDVLDNDAIRKAKEMSKEHFQ